MRSYVPVLPFGAAAPARALVSLSLLLGRWLKAVAKVRRNRAQARALAQVDGRMLADMGITRSDLRDAFSEPFWEDPTALLRERALERRMGRRLSRAEQTPQAAEFNRALRHVPAERTARRTA